MGKAITMKSKRDLGTPLAPTGKFDPKDLNKDGKVTIAEKAQYHAGKALGDSTMFYNPKMNAAGKAIRNEVKKTVATLTGRDKGKGVVKIKK